MATDTNPFILPVQLSAAAISALIDAQVPQTLLADENFQGKNTSVSVKRAGEIVVELLDQLPAYEIIVRLQIPLALYVERSVVFTPLSLEGSLILSIELTVTVLPSWDLTLRSRILGHEWLEKPQAAFGKLEFTIARLMNVVLQKSGSKITSQLDSGFQQQVQFPGLLASLSQQFTQYQQVGKNPKLFASLCASEWRVSPMQVAQGTLMFQLTWSCLPTVVAGSCYLTAGDVFLPLQKEVSPLTGPQALTVRAMVSYSALEHVLAKAVVGKSFGKLGFTVTPHGVRVLAEGNRLAFRVSFTGSISGDFRLSAKPIFNAASQKLELETITIDGNADSALAQLGLKLLRQRIVSVIRERFTKELSSQLVRLQKEANDQLHRFEPTQGVVVQGSLHDLSPQAVLVGADRLSLVLLAQLEAELIVERIPVLQNR